ncbi:MAG: excinuclease ABC subunit UvrB [Parcubacteria group bacterium]|nr:excinuclease ABC subunit UvrB [Parcubacteria group bacterium]MCR4342375.1 excinuclease ABC subunit UvrB [Patescibacteria group bacterium]
MSKFKLKSKFKPAGDQPKAINELAKGIHSGLLRQTLLGVTGSGKTFTVANVIEKIQKPTLVIAHNKTLAAQLASEYEEFFPDSAVHYFVSYYDYYQPEAYIPITDTYIEKETQINEEIDRLRHASTQALLSRSDVIIVASVSCIYGLGSPKEYEESLLKIEKNEKMSRVDLLHKLIAIYFERTNADLLPGKFRVVGNSIEIMPVNERVVYNIKISGDSIGEILKIDPVSSHILKREKTIFLFPAKHFITGKDKRDAGIESIKKELRAHLKKLEKEGKLLEAERLRRRTLNDIALIREIGYCNGIENYSRHFRGVPAGTAPETLLSYFPYAKDGKPDFLTIIDESHVTVPQIAGMYAGDASRKKTLVEYGFRLPSAMDNRPLNFKEFEERVGQVVYTSATPGNYEKEVSENIVEQIIRPTGLIDPEIKIKPIIEKGKYRAKPLGGRPTQPEAEYRGQIADFIEEARKTAEKGERSIATTLTKKMAEDLASYLKEQKIKAEYLHSEIKTLDRIKILTDFRRGKFDCLVGINLLREGLDLPEVSFIGILDADKEGFLRSETSLIQTIGRAARNSAGRVILYADTVTGSMKRAIGETERRRKIQIAYNKKHKITPKTIIKKIHDITEALESQHQKTVKAVFEMDKKLFEKNPKKLIKDKEKQMSQAVKELDFETAAILRDEIKEIEKMRDEKIKERNSSTR